MYHQTALSRFMSATATAIASAGIKPLDDPRQLMREEKLPGHPHPNRGKGRRIPSKKQRWSTSKYQPHQGAKERAKRAGPVFIEHKDGRIWTGRYPVGTTNINDREQANGIG